MARRRFFVNEVRSGRALVEGDDAHHLTRVLRVEPGERYEISDNERVWLAEVETARKSLVEFRVLEELAAAAPAISVTLYPALIKFERLELLMEKATELGAAAITPVIAERSERGLERAAEKRLPRWQRIGREASEQSRRTRMPEISGALRFGAVLERGEGCRLLLDEDPHALPILRGLPEQETRFSALCGPEGGWTEKEKEAAMQAGWTAVSLGAGVLRSETASLAALAVLNAWAKR